MLERMCVNHSYARVRQTDLNLAPQIGITSISADPMSISDPMSAGVVQAEVCGM
jgi:hypothetical protein